MSANMHCFCCCRISAIEEGQTHCQSCKSFAEQYEPMPPPSPRWPVAFAAFAVLLSIALVYAMELNRRDLASQVNELEQLVALATETTYKMETRIQRAHMTQEEKRLWKEGVDAIEKRAAELKLKGRPEIVKMNSNIVTKEAK